LKLHGNGCIVYLYPVLSISFWQGLNDWDRSAFLAINRNLANPLFDAVLPWFRDSIFWAPLYLFIVVFVTINYGKKGLWWALLFLSTVAISDLLGTYAFKEIVQRIRPCNEVALANKVRLVIQQCPGGYSFVSNHAANHFGLATYMALSFRGAFGPWIYLAYLWAFLVAFAQVYVGVHYPLDVLAGALLGIAAGYVTASVYRANFGTPVPLV
jgi:membrane-associated phospholipid phosphatase